MKPAADYVLLALSLGGVDGTTGIKELEIIGNIYENLELLKEENESLK